MKVLVVGATGATGRLLVKQLLERGYEVKAIVRSAQKMRGLVGSHPALSLVEASVLDLGEDELAAHVQGCDAVASCLGHNLTFKGLFGHPRRLVTEAIQKLCQAIRANRPETPVKFVLMNTTGVKYPEVDGPRSLAEKLVIWLLRHLLPPHSDNERAAAYLREEVGPQDPQIHWSIVRPDNLLDHEETSAYTIHPAPLRSPIFDAGVTSRINVAHWMAELIADHQAWDQWKSQMPVVYNQVQA